MSYSTTFDEVIDFRVDFCVIDFHSMKFFYNKAFGNGECMVLRDQSHLIYRELWSRYNQITPTLPSNRLMKQNVVYPLLKRDIGSMFNGQITYYYSPIPRGDHVHLLLMKIKTTDGLVPIQACLIENEWVLISLPLQECLMSQTTLLDGYLSQMNDGTYAFLVSDVIMFRGHNTVLRPFDIRYSYASEFVTMANVSYSKCPRNDINELKQPFRIRLRKVYPMSSFLQLVDVHNDSNGFVFIPRQSPVPITHLSRDRPQMKYFSHAIPKATFLCKEILPDDKVVVDVMNVLRNNNVDDLDESNCKVVALYCIDDSTPSSTNMFGHINQTPMTTLFSYGIVTTNTSYISSMEHVSTEQLLEMTTRNIHDSLVTCQFYAKLSMWVVTNPTSKSKCFSMNHILTIMDSIRDPVRIEDILK